MMYDCVRIWMNDPESAIKVTQYKYTEADGNKIIDQFRKECLNITYDIDHGALVITPKNINKTFRDIVDSLALTFKMESMQYLQR